MKNIKIYISNTKSNQFAKIPAATFYQTQAMQSMFQNIKKICVNML